VRGGLPSAAVEDKSHCRTFSSLLLLGSIYS
jgi:hypothetical protein